MEQLYPKLAEIFEVETVAPNDALRDFDTWDSLTQLSIIALIDTDCGATITAADMTTVVTIADLVALVARKT